jgi:hypothetical protein
MWQFDCGNKILVYKNEQDELNSHMYILNLSANCLLTNQLNESYLSTIELKLGFGITPKKQDDLGVLCRLFIK